MAEVLGSQFGREKDLVGATANLLVSLSVDNTVRLTGTGLPITLVMPKNLKQLMRASRMAAKVSAVSPD